jgi:hypothetical protein
MAAKLEATIHKLPRVKRDALLRDVEGIRVQLTALLSATNAENRRVELGLKAKK